MRVWMRYGCKKLRGTLDNLPQAMLCVTKSRQLNLEFWSKMYKMVSRVIRVGTIIGKEVAYCREVDNRFV